MFRRPRIRRLEELLPFVREGRYRIGPHVAKHMIQEGFIEHDVLQAIEWGRELAVYPEESRMLVLGYMVFPPQLRLPLHVVLEYREQRWVDIVTAFIPKKPHEVYSRARIAAILRFDGTFEEVRWKRPRVLSPEQIPK
ncbi:DUF4258 domain-containing protein [Meiothermus granaticius]|uniref:DUF4258 domain-containing protein n=1 Tax=Meiothermus granaticius NBRC 107808 TaxID=1227551 RepID=A0A399F6Z5_9DEIN|nr:DUF4258 domain-containing protein [Meiothermus granaticius]MCL6527781.1 DUF4258 domain-containing protein [Thermaceae bacterium]RIH91890.1 hypothetical protein Mgrana_02165 [Meiothermus granaticius NBRC 107808]GEM85490.1 hypothetical protein MGR01S_01150 [Meiothermus granaticius NBRC 107808]